MDMFRKTMKPVEQVFKNIGLKKEVVQRVLSQRYFLRTQLRCSLGCPCRRFHPHPQGPAASQGVRWKGTFQGKPLPTVQLFRVVSSPVTRARKASYSSMSTPPLLVSSAFRFSGRQGVVHLCSIRRSPGFQAASISRATREAQFHHY